MQWGKALGPGRPEYRAVQALLVGVVLAFVGFNIRHLLTVNAHATSSAEQDTHFMANSMPSWVEPRSLNITSLVGQIHDSLLQGVIISAYPWDGIVQFESSSVSENTMVITTTIHGRLHFWGTYFGCLGQVPRSDEMGSAAPPSHLRIYTPNGSEVTSQITHGNYWPATLTQPLAGTATWQGRYDSLPLTIRQSDQGLELPANVGCDLHVSGSYAELIGVFTLQHPTASPVVNVVGTQSASYESYIGIGEVGRFRPLMDQMQALYADRHTYIKMSIPPEANYIFAVYQPMQGDYPGMPYDASDPNRSLPSAGTTRLRASNLSGDLANSGAFPLQITWQDADLTSSSSTYLPEHRNPSRFTAPEFVFPPGVAYNDCFVFGTCSNELLAEIYNTSAPITLVYLSVSAPPSGYDLIPIKFAGPYWAPNAGGQAAPTKAAASRSGGTYTAYLPALLKFPDPSQCPYGYFNAEGQMIAYVDC